MTTSKTKKRQEQNGIKGRDFDIASKLFNLTDAKNPSEPEQRLRCPICGAKHCFDFNRESTTFHCEVCKFFGDLNELVQKARKVSRNEANDIIAEATGLCTDEKRNERIPATAVTEVPAVPVEPPVPTNDPGDTVSEQNDGNTAGGYSSHLEVETQMIPLDQIELSDDYQFRVQDDEETIENYADILRQYCDDLEEDQSANYPFPSIKVLKENDDVYYVISGRHRYQAARKAGIEEMECVVLTDRIEAIQEGLRSNRQHGLRLNNADKAHCIKLALGELDWSNRQIADLVGCSRQYVDKIAKKERPSSQQKVVGKDCKKYPASVKRNEPMKDGEPVEEVPEIAPVTVLPKTLSNQNDPIIDKLQAALTLTVDTQKRSDALLGVFRMMVDCFEDTLVRRDFLQDILEECAMYAVHPIEAHGSNKDAA